jgi:hypothetical protein
MESMMNDDDVVIIAALYYKMDTAHRLALTRNAPVDIIGGDFASKSKEHSS